MPRVEKGLSGKRGVREIARIPEIRYEIIAAPKPRGVAGEGVGPALDEESGVGFVAEFAAGRGADVMAHVAAERDEVDVAGGGGAEAEIDVFAAVDVRGVEAAQFFPERASQHDACAGDGDHAAVTRGEKRPT